jgi:hypothetical protein
MFRETNTIGSKANDVEISMHVIEIKGPRFTREMIQNVDDAARKVRPGRRRAGAMASRRPRRAPPRPTPDLLLLIHEFTKRGRLIVISGPSGRRQETLLKKLFGRCEGLRASVSATTDRATRRDGIDYYFPMRSFSGGAAANLNVARFLAATLVWTLPARSPSLEAGSDNLRRRPGPWPSSSDFLNP